MSDSFSFAESPPMAAPAESSGHQSAQTSPEGPTVNFEETIIIPTPNGVGASPAIGDPRRLGATLCDPSASEVPEGGVASHPAPTAGVPSTPSRAGPSTGSTYPQAGADGAAAGLCSVGDDGDGSSHSRIGAGVREILAERGSGLACHPGRLGETDKLAHTRTNTESERSGQVGQSARP